MPQRYNVSTLWQSLGSFWADFEDKGVMEVVWNAYRDIITEEYRTTYQLNLSKAFQYMPDYFEERLHYFDIIYSADTATYSGLVNTTIISGLYNYYVPGEIFSIVSGLDHYYYLNEDNQRMYEHLTEDTDFEIIDYSRIQFLNNPPFTADGDLANVDGGSLYAPAVFRINPIMFALFGTLVDITKEQFKERKYHAFKTEVTNFEQQKTDLKHFKYLIWSLNYLKRQKPTIEVLKKLYGVAKGVPFAYVSGYVESIGIDGSNYTLTIAEETYYVPDILTLAVTSGQAIGQFDLLVSGIEVRDYITDQARMIELAEEPWQARAMLEFVADSSLNILDYDETFVSGIVTDITPAYMTAYFN